ncbi:MAG TPA: nickel-type superoxide dismutase maturation protease [Acidimicrobiales bacterium]|nr:nickel-type superoxide dismutase maturation protease [Acidimicrobiales bacterium]
MTEGHSSRWPRSLQRLAAMDRDRLRRHVLTGAGTLAAASLAVAGHVIRRRFLRLRIEGLSMVPVLAPGDRVLVLRTDRVTVGDIVAFTDPDASGAVLVKRVAGVDRSSVRVEGDNSGTSKDSRHFGPVPRSAVIGRVLWCYWSPYHPAKAGR